MPVRNAPLPELMLTSLLSSLTIAALVRVAIAKRRNPYWSTRRAVRARAGNFALPIEAMHDVLGPSRVHRLERALLKVFA